METVLKEMNISPLGYIILGKVIRDGELQAGDRVRIIGSNQELNGRVGTILSSHGDDYDNNGDSNPYVAKLPDGRYKVHVEMENEETNRDDEIPSGIVTSEKATRIISLKRENLIMEDVSLGTLAMDSKVRAIMKRRGLNARPVSEIDAEEPGLAGWFPAVLQGDAKRTREILEYGKGKGIQDPGDSYLDATGDRAIMGAISKGHIEILKILLEYGGDPNRYLNMPGIREDKVSYFIVAILAFDSFPNAEETINILIDGVGNSKRANVNAVSLKGTPLIAAIRIRSNHAARLRICKKLLDSGADPNLVFRDPNGNEGHVLSLLCGEEFGSYTEANRIEIIQLLLDAGADPGFMTKVNKETVNPIHLAVNRNLSNVLKCFLSSEKGRAAVNAKRFEVRSYPMENNGDGETAITMCVGAGNLEFHKTYREMAVQLFKAGADPDIEDHLGISANTWLADRNPAPDRPHRKKNELDSLVKRAAIIGLSFWDSDEVNRFIIG